MPTGRSKYRVDLEEHLDALRDQQTLYASVLIQSYALAESAAAEHLSVDSRHLLRYRGLGSHDCSAGTAMIGKTCRAACPARSR